MTSQQKRSLKELIINGQSERALLLLNSIDTTPTRTDSQHNSWFLWLSMIEHEAENAGITWNHVVQHTHQLRITKEGLQEMGKQLQKALWGTTSTKELKKTGQIDILIMHFVDLFSKVGLTLPPFPNDEEKENQLIKSLDMASRMTYPDNYQEPTI